MKQGCKGPVEQELSSIRMHNSNKEHNMALTDKDVLEVRRAAARYGIPEAFALGIIDKESAGNALWSVGKKRLPAIRIEGHYFYKLLGAVDTNKRDLAVQHGLAAKKAGAVKNPTNYEARYALLERLKDIDTEIAYQSISIGIGQVMGTWHKRLGFNSAELMFQDACNGLIPQAIQMLTFISTDAGLMNAVKSKNFAKFARIYNGPAYGDYDKSLKKFVDKWEVKTGKTEIDSADHPDMALADPSTEVLNRIILLGYASVKEFQKAAGLKVDGLVGPLTTNAVTAKENAVRAEQTGLRNSAAKVAVTAATTGSAVAAPYLANIDLDTVSKYTDFAKGFIGVPITFILGAVGVVAVGAAGVATYEWWKNRKPADVL